MSLRSHTAKRKKAIPGSVAIKKENMIILVVIGY
jgi:hypothetical protein